jgi:hypothetical protein
VLFEYLAFVDDWRFFRGRGSNTGVSASSLAFGVFRSAVLFLYLLDADTSWLILGSIAKDVALGLWKLASLRRLTTPRPRVQASVSEGNAAAEEEVDKTNAFDSIASTHVILALLPLILGVALHSLRFSKHRSYYSWLISSLADSMYLFGFAAMCPQLYVNYKLRSVAHMPIRALMYVTTLSCRVVF